MSGAEDRLRERFEQLAAAAADGELDGAALRELEGILRERPELRAELEEQRKVKEVLGTMRFAQPPEEVWDRYRATVARRLEQGIGWVLLCAGVALLLGYGVFRGILGLVRADLSVWIKAGALAAAAGLALLVASLVRERLFVRARERYGEVRR